MPAVEGAPAVYRRSMVTSNETRKRATFKAGIGVVPEHTQGRRVGTISSRISSRFAANSVASTDKPVTFPPGRARFDTSPVPTGSPTAEKTIGMVVVAFCAAMAAGVLNR
jgi:hypothetical protein